MGARRPVWLRVWLIGVLIGMGILSACNIEQVEPVIVLDPISGGPGTSVAVTGSGFPAEIEVSVRLGPPSVGATPQSYGDTTTDAGGSFALSFTMPTHWPDGAPITETDLIVVVLNEDGSVKASAPFGYSPLSLGASMLLGSRAETHRQVVLAWHREGGTAGLCSDAVVYENGYVELVSCQENGSLEQRLLSREAVDRLHAWEGIYRSFEIERTSGAGANRVLTRITFMGYGSREISAMEVQMIQSLLETLVLSR